MKDGKLEIGDKIYRSHYGKITMFVIDRLTPKRAFANTSEFDITVGNNGFVKQYKVDSWIPSVRYGIEDLEKQYIRQNLIAKAEKIVDFKLLSNEAIQQIINIAKAITNENHE
jgi:hypothetical protein